ncbi:MAG: hypothetical protein SPK94_07915 [Bacteroidales bacterium]|nr:hypothetical protein [Bacteroidales bacterium]
MLEIKGNINKLKNYRFYKVGNDWLFGDEQDCCIAVDNDGHLVIYYTCPNFYLEGNIPDFILDKLYVLIKDGVVEKVVKE